jgi:hypothetical protein
MPESATPDPAVIEIRLRLERRVTDRATDDFEAVVRDILTDPRGWQKASFAFTFGDDAPFAIVLAEGDVVEPRARAGRAVRARWR